MKRPAPQPTPDSLASSIANTLARQAALGDALLRDIRTIGLTLSIAALTGLTLLVPDRALLYNGVIISAVIGLVIHSSIDLHYRYKPTPGTGTPETSAVRCGFHAHRIVRPNLVLMGAACLAVTIWILNQHPSTTPTTSTTSGPLWQIVGAWTIYLCFLTATAVATQSPRPTTR